METWDKENAAVVREHENEVPEAPGGDPVKARSLGEAASQATQEGSGPEECGDAAGSGELATQPPTQETVREEAAAEAMGDAGVEERGDDEADEEVERACKLLLGEASVEDAAEGEAVAVGDAPAGETVAQEIGETGAEAKASNLAATVSDLKEGTAAAAAAAAAAPAKAAEAAEETPRKPIKAAEAGLPDPVPTETTQDCVDFLDGVDGRDTVNANAEVAGQLCEHELGLEKAAGESANTSATEAPGVGFGSLASAAQFHVAKPAEDQMAAAVHQEVAMGDEEAVPADDQTTLAVSVGASAEDAEIPAEEASAEEASAEEASAEEAPESDTSMEIDAPAEDEVPTNASGGSPLPGASGDGAEEVVIPKRPMSAYFRFMEGKRAEVKASLAATAGIGEIAKAVGALWANLADEEKQPYLKEADAAKAEYQRVMEDLKARGLLVPREAEAYDIHGHQLAFPIARVRKAALSDPEVKRMSKEAISVVAKATEHFLASLTKHTEQQAFFASRKTLKATDVADAVYNKKVYKFLRKKPFSVLREADRSASSRPAKKMRKEEAAQGTKSITSFFKKR